MKIPYPKLRTDRMVFYSQELEDLDRELDSYRTIVPTEPEAAPNVGKLIAETNQERRRLEILLGRAPAARRPADDVKALGASLKLDVLSGGARFEVRLPRPTG